MPLWSAALSNNGLRSAVAAAAQNGPGRIVSVIGEAGLGKSRLIAELQTGTGAGAVLTLCCGWKGNPNPSKQPRRMPRSGDLFQDYFDLDAGAGGAIPGTADQGADRRRAARPGRNRRAIFRLYAGSYPWNRQDAERIKFLQPPELRGAFFDLVFNTLGEPSWPQPQVVLYLDDLHWVDPTSLELLQSLLPLVRAKPAVDHHRFPAASPGAVLVLS